MLLSTLKNTRDAERLHPLLKPLFDYVNSHDLLNAPLGRIEIQGDDLFINNVESTLVKAEDQVVEVHRNYIDVHIPLSTAETIGWASLETLTKETKPYSEEGDCALFSDKPSTYVDVRPGQFLVCMPEDAHAPIIGDGKIRKLIAKVRI